MEKKTATPEDQKPAEQETPVTTVEETPVDPIAELTKKCDEANDRYLRLVAEFENYKKRNQRDAENTVRYANEKFARDMVDVLDNFERALKGGDEDLRAGLEQIHKLYLSVLSRNGVEPMNAEGKKFDPINHEAVAHIPSDIPEGMIVDEAIRGYLMHDKVLRHAKVAVSAGKQ
ncbi:nucleotide exchange factor GrpE [Methanorbis rubei]|uniref:Protein GrpE n=1 Tax=Methanorbis rubei TaxID=3028300 RepID=A0AAE4MGE2_9EURY|nr:Protein GrpE [Methanocorpusculaceae archaeon Cs1]